MLAAVKRCVAALQYISANLADCSVAQKNQILSAAVKQSDAALKYASAVLKDCSVEQKNQIVLAAVIVLKSKFEHRYRLLDDDVSISLCVKYDEACGNIESKRF